MKVNVARRGCWMVLEIIAVAACTDGHAATVSAAGTPVVAVKHAERGLSLAARVGKELFFDERLSASGKMACATCHDPNNAYGPPSDRAVELGGPDGTASGVRAVPSLRYKEYTPAYADVLDNPDGMSAPGPGGGFAWDGRVNTLAEQAKLPLLSPVEMANASAADVVEKVKAGPNGALFEKAFGASAWNDADQAFQDVLAALQAFQLEDPSFHPYTSKFDLHAGNKIGGNFTPAEARGASVFSDPKKGNCASCHFPGAGLNGSSGLFTDFSYEAIGVPRNMGLPVNVDPKFYDLGVCGPSRTDHPSDTHGANRFCGMFKTPTLRNVVARKSFFHNGVIRSLERAIRFYNTRDTNPELWYPTSHGVVNEFDDLPKAYRSNIDAQMPLDNRKRGSRPAMTERNIADLTCFLETLTDDYVVPTVEPKTGRCVD